VGVSRPVALTVAGSDSSGGAGIVADLKTFESHGVWGTTAIVAVTAQNTRGVKALLPLPPSLVRAQITAVTDDVGVDAAKTGMLATAELVETVAEALRAGGVQQVVVDPVMQSSHGERLLADGAVDALRRRLLPLATVVTPNLAEAAALTGMSVPNRRGMAAAARALADLGARVVVVTGGHLGGEDGCPDLLWADGSAEWLEGPRIPGRHTHGTGCVFSAAVTAGLAVGQAPGDAVMAAKAFVASAVAAAFPLGAGIGPVDPGRATSPTAPS
jgi:hydroxymethylpyrimidine/phosphomethylpyrimidine kinase